MKCFEVDLDELEQSLSDMREITDVGFKKDAMRENLLTLNRTFQAFKNNPDSLRIRSKKVPEKEWKKLSGSARDIGCRGDKTYIVSNTGIPGGYSVKVRVGDRFIDFEEGAAERVAVAEDGLPWSLDNVGYIHHFDRFSWVYQGENKGYFYDIGYGGRNLWLVDGANIYRREGVSPYVKIPGGGIYGVRVAVQDNGQAWVVD